MSTSVCSVCFAGNRRMNPIKNTEREVFENITSTKLRVADALCFVCVAQLQRCRRFAETARRATAVLTQIARRGLEATQDTLTLLNIETVENLSVSNPHSMYTLTIKESEKGSAEAAVKQEPVLKVEVILQEEEATFEVPFVDGLVSEDLKEPEPLKVEDGIAPTGGKLPKRDKKRVLARRMRYNCDICSRAVDNLYNLQKHRATHTEDPKSLTCETCSKTFPNYHSVRMHMRTHTLPYACAQPGCGKAFAQRGQLTVHSRVHTGERPYACDQCSNTYTQITSLKFHQISHTGKKPYKCDACSKTFKKKCYLRTHVRTHRTESHPCELCGEVFPQLERLESHCELAHSAAKPHVCSHCDASFAVRPSLLRHLTSHAENVFTCDRCAKSFRDKRKLRNHMYMHSGLKPHACLQPGCGKSFARTSQLKGHSRVHTGERPYACKECDKTFSQTSSLSFHQKLHSGEKPYVCEMCGKRFTDRFGLQKHLRLHAGALPFACDACELRFAYPSALRRHSKSHQGKKPYVCDLCDKIFARNCNLRQHMKSHLRKKQVLQSAGMAIEDNSS